MVSLVILGLMLMFIVSLVRNLVDFLSFRGRLSGVEKEVSELTEKQSQLKEAVSKVEQPGFEEDYIKDKLGLVAPDEAVVLIPDELLRTGSVPQERDIMGGEQEEIVWKKWVKLFF
jgi:cell division protein FtsB